MYILLIKGLCGPSPPLYTSSISVYISVYMILRMYDLCTYRLHVLRVNILILANNTFSILCQPQPRPPLLLLPSPRPPPNVVGDDVAVAVADAVVVVLSRKWQVFSVICGILFILKQHATKKCQKVNDPSILMLLPSATSISSITSIISSIIKLMSLGPVGDIFLLSATGKNSSADK